MENNFIKQKQVTQLPIEGSSAVLSEALPQHNEVSLATSSEVIHLQPEKLRPNTQEKVTAFLKNLESYQPDQTTLDPEQAQFLIHHLAQGIETEDSTTQMNRYVDIVKLCLQIKNKELYTHYSKKLREITAEAEAASPTVEESVDRINQLIDHARLN